MPELFRVVCDSSDYILVHGRNASGFHGLLFRVSRVFRGQLVRDYLTTEYTEDTEEETKQLGSYRSVRFVVMFEENLELHGHTKRTPK